MLFVCASCLIAANAAQATEGAEMLLADQGHAKAVIIVALDASPAEKHAAEELAKFLNKITDAEFLIANVDSTKQKSGRILVGTTAARQADPQFDPKLLPSEAIVIKTIGSDLIIAGGSPRGTLYAAYSFLDNVIGCRWWTAKASTIPHIPTLKIPQLDIRHAPQFDYREPYWFDVYDIEWRVHNKVNGTQGELDEAHGGRHSISLLGHSFYKYLPPSTYFEKHPEWYSLVNGKRVADLGQLCLTNDEMRKEFTKNVLADFRDKPGIYTIFVAQEDWEGYCTCDKCAAIDAAEESHAGTLLHFVNAVAADVEKEFPDARISTLAYEYTQTPPKTVKARDNVLIWLCTTGVSYAHPLTDPVNKQYRERHEEWAKIATNIHIWDYVTNFANYQAPFPNLRTLGPNMKFFAEHNVKGIYSLGAYSGAGAEMGDIRAWVIARLMWDPSQDGDALIDEYLNGYYGPAADEIKAYIDTTHDAIAATGEELTMTDHMLGKWLSLQTLTESLSHLRKAQEAVATNAELLHRVKMAELPVLYVFLTRWDELQEQAEATDTPWPFDQPIKVVYDNFMERAKAGGINSWSEGSARDSFASVADRVNQREGIVPPPGCEGLPRGTWVQVQDGSFNLKAIPGVEIKPDAKASDGSAAYMPGDIDARAVQKQMWRIYLIQSAKFKGKKLRLQAAVRCEGVGSDGPAFMYGIEDGTAPQGNVTKEVNARDISDSEYHVYDFGTFDDLRGWKSAWFSPVKGNVKGVWIDRIWLIEE